MKDEDLEKFLPPAVRYPNFMEIIAQKQKEQEEQMKLLLSMEKHYQAVTRIIKNLDIKRDLRIAVYGSSVVLKLEIDRNDYFRSLVLPLVRELIAYTASTCKIKDGVYYKFTVSDWSQGGQATFYLDDCTRFIYLNFDFEHHEGCEDVKIVRVEKLQTIYNFKYRTIDKDLKELIPKGDQA